LSLPLMPVSAVATVLLASIAAQAGWWLAWRGGLLLCAGAGLGVFVCSDLVGVSTPAADILSAALLLSCALGLGLTSFAKAQRLHRVQTDLEQRSAVLDQLNRRLSRYLPGPVNARIQRQPEQLCTLERRWIVFARACGYRDCCGSWLHVGTTRAIWSPCLPALAWRVAIAPWVTGVRNGSISP
jgi:hypothetical protein